ncbi:hypothetical protein GWC95_09225 [Sediminibacterium roseum]|uniref:Uncharacterized protein n=1 Tax=Sediminibacterium roseum TaxID=1978412 RepID=A0ABW9ZSJ9_9BACT|nr:hypothetical protein [Sediminibacterium roseum]NCI50102.1 hypothetical protein [Sediminibacterium roseum]
MKKSIFILAILATLITACGNNSSSNSDSNGKSMTPLSDSAKIDTVRPTDSIIKG